jgi:hypothetical protein
MLSDKGTARQIELNNLAQQLKRKIKELKNDTISDYLRELMIVLITLFGRQPKKLTGLLCRFPQSGKQMANSPGTMN